MDHVTRKDQTPVTYGKSKLKYPLRSSTKSTIEKPSRTNLSNSVSVKRDKSASSISRSVGILEASGKQSVAKQPPQRRFSIATKPANLSMTKSVGSVTPIYEKGGKMFSSYNNSQGKQIAPGLDSATKSLNRRKFNLLSSSSYWVSQIKLFESANKHSISLGLFKLALEAEVVPFHKKQLKEELKSYVSRHNNLTTHEELVRDLFRSYEIEGTPEQVKKTMDDGDPSSDSSKSMKPKSTNITRASSRRLESEKKTTRMGTPIRSSVREVTAKAPTPPKHESAVVSLDKKVEENKENIQVS